MQGVRGWLRRSSVAVVAAGAVTVAVTGLASASVSTDGYYYNAGDTVQITGDQMAPGENVTVDIDYPDGSLAQEHVVLADDSGNFVDSYIVPSGAPAGVYAVVATGQSSGSVFTTTFDPPANTSTSLTITPGHSTGTAGQVWYGDTLAFSGATTSSSTVNTGSIDVKQSKERHDSLCTTADFANDKFDVYTQSLTDGTYDSGAVSPVLSTFPTNGVTGGYAVADAEGPPNPVPYVSAVGTYAFQSSYSGGQGSFKSSDSDCVQEDVVQAPTTTTSTPADGSGTTLTQVGVGVPFYVQWGVSSAYGVSPNVAAGTVTLNQSGSGLGCPAGSLNAKSFTANETTGTGFSYTADAANNAANRFSCSATAVGIYTVNVTFADNPDTALTNPDGNYQGSSSSASGITVNQLQVQACMAAPAIAAAYLKAHGVKVNSTKSNNIIQQIANEMAGATRAQFPTYTYTAGTPSSLSSPGALLRPCDNGYAQSVQNKTQYYIDTTR